MNARNDKTPPKNSPERDMLLPNCGKNKEGKKEDKKEAALWENKGSSIAKRRKDKLKKSFVLHSWIPALTLQWIRPRGKKTYTIKKPRSERAGQTVN